MAANTYGRQVIEVLTNKSGGSVAAGDVVIISTGNDTAFTTNTASAYTGLIGIAQETIANNAAGRILTSGYAALVNVNASVTRGNFGKTHTVAKQATDAGASRAVGAFCQFLTGGATPTAHVFGMADTSSTTGFTTWFNVMTYGATNDGTTADETAINAAIAALNSAGEGVLYFPAGTGYEVNSALTAITANCLITGDGIEASKIICTSATAVMFTLTGAGVTVRDLWLSNSATASAGAAIRVSSSGNLNRYEDLIFQGFWIGLDIQSGTAWAARGLYSESNVKYVVKVSGTNPDWSISDSYFTNAVSADAAIRIESTVDGGGGKITNTKINGHATTGFNYGIDLAAQTTTDTVILLVSNCSIENTRSHGINGTTAAATSKYGYIQITNCEISPYSSNTAKAISLVATTAADFYDITIIGCTFRTNGTARTAMTLTNVDNVVIAANAYRGFTSAFTATTSTKIDSDVRRGTAFPAGPATNDQFYRTDLALECYYDGTRWVTTELFREILSPAAATPAVASIPIGRMPMWHTTFDLYVVNFYTSLFPATTNNGTNYWTVALNKKTVTDAATVIATLNTSAYTVDNWTTAATSVAAVVVQGTNKELDVQAIPTLAPGGLYYAIAVSYRLVVT